MIIEFMGTGSVCGVPIWNCPCNVCRSKDPKDKRLRSSLLVRIGKKIIVIDFGPDFRSQLLRHKVRRIDYAFLTHAHGDHMNGYHELSKQPGLVLESGAPALKEFFARQGSSRNWLKRRNPTIRIRPFRKKKVGDVVIDVVRMRHDKDYDAEPLPTFGYVFRSSRFSFAYLTDYARIVDGKKLGNLDLIISDSSGWDGGKGHAGVKGSLETYEKFKPKRMLLTHINHKTGHKALTAFLKGKGNVSAAYDGLRVTHR